MNSKVLGLALLAGSGAAFAPLSSTGLGGDERLQLCTSNAPCQRVCARLASSPLLALRSQMDRNELSAVQRMTKGYDKLCKNCPTRLQPRVDTLTEMIMGLTTGERDELLKVVAQRIDATSAAGDGEMRGGVSTPREVYDFQLTGQTPSTMALNAGAGMTPPMVESSTRTTTMDKENTKMKEDKMKMIEDKMRGSLGEEGDKMTMKLMGKIEKCREKVAKNEMKLARAQRMLVVAEMLLAQGKDAQIPECSTDAMDPEIAMDITELRMMSPDMIEMKRLKYVEKQAKYVRKVAECKMDLAEAASKYEAIKSPTSCATPPPACVA